MTRLQHFMVLGTAVSAFMTFTTAGHAQEAQKELLFYPAKPWEVASIKPVTDYSGECVIQTEFNNGFLLQMNGSSNWVQQLNLNIRQNAFETGKTYNVSLSVPGQISEIVTGKAHRENILSVPLKGQKSLYKTLRDNGVIDLSIEGNDFRFFLTGFNAAARKFEK